MSVKKWNESGRVWEEDHGLLDAEQVTKCERADVDCCSVMDRED